ncbi:hypothetical protein [Alteromonas mediterranea]|nr:hypothetical protein [Alteromonas mediterranea]
MRTSLEQGESLRSKALRGGKENESTESNVGPPCAEVTTKSVMILHDVL